MQNKLIYATTLVLIYFGNQLGYLHIYGLVALLNVACKAALQSPGIVLDVTKLLFTTTFQRKTYSSILHTLPRLKKAKHKVLAFGSHQWPCLYILQSYLS